ncbi:uncharacterized protein G6M90_00g107240 [Metarhizium brunneum]|uniref:Uncharacterized protein n=1 Tax=Metarhizium brunneum TaxID=500148 RepID=A0A7D5ZBX3_9HYPO
MASIVPDVEQVTIKLRSEPGLKSASVDVSNDYGTPNVLFLYYTPFIPDDNKLDLDAIQDEFQSWNAWELGQAETQLIRHVEAGNLPSDDSIASRIIRNNYRSKAIDFFRQGNEAWLSLANNSTAQKVIVTAQSEAHGSIRQEMRALAAEQHLQSQFEVIINAISGSVEVAEENKFYFTHVYYRYDNNSRRFLPVISDTTFGIKKGDEGSQAGGDKVKLEINLSVNTYNFDRKFWRDHRHEGEEAIQMGEPIRKQMALDFYVNS